MSLKLYVKKNDDLSKVLLAGECEIWEELERVIIPGLKYPKVRRKSFLDLLIFTQT